MAIRFEKAVSRMFEYNCQRCQKILKHNEILYFQELVNNVKVWGIPMGISVLRVCPQCYAKLKQEQDFKQKGLKQCTYCDTIHSINEKCPKCGAP